MSDPADPLSSLQLSPASRAPLPVLVSQQLRDAILSGRVSAGTELPPEHELAERFGVGRSTVREAVRILQSQGLLSGGDTVSTRRPRVAAEAGLSGAAATAMENAVRLGLVPLGDLVALRVLLEGANVEAAARAAPEALAEARAALDDMAAGRSVEDFLAADLRFHHGLALASGNAAMPLVMGALRGAIASHLEAALARCPDPDAVIAALIAEHMAILDAVAEGRAEAAQALVRAHIRDFYRHKASA